MISRTAALGIAMVTAALGLYVMWSELPTFLNSFTGPEERLSRLASGQSRLGLSSGSAQNLMDDCLEGISQYDVPTAPGDRHEAILSRCRELAGAVTSRSPSDSYAWLIRALVEVQDGDTAAATSSLQHSEVTGRNEGWIAELRVNMVEDFFGGPPNGLGDAYQNDLLVLLAGEQSVQRLSKRYTTDPEFHARVEQVLSRLPVEQQNRVKAALDVPG